MKIHVGLSEDFQQLMVKDLNEEHNHDVQEVLYL